MKRMHMHVSVDDLTTSIRFYTAMFGVEPSVAKSDYAKWMLDDPRVNFAISKRDDRHAGLNHVGIQAESNDELDDLYKRLGDASFAMLEEKGAKCCYAESDKHWAVDPSGVVWEMFHSMGEIAVYGEDRGEGVDPLVRRAARAP